MLETVSTAPTPTGRSTRRWRPGFVCFFTVFVVYACLGWRSIRGQTGVSVLSMYTSVVWTLPVAISGLGMLGAVLTAVRLRRIDRTPALDVIVGEMLVVVVPTIGRTDVIPALERVLRSFDEHIPACFSDVRVDVVVDEGCEAELSIEKLAAGFADVRIVIVPGTYRTRAGTRFKARANQYAHELRILEEEARDDVWVLHMDDDTAVGVDTVSALARFISAQAAAGDQARHLAQGVLSFPRELALNRLVWLADAVRPACDISVFAATTGLGSPRFGLHGELLLVRASVEADIGWDFGPATIVEDAQFALEFCTRYEGGSDWIEGRSYGASPATVADFLRQRERWVWGLIAVATNRRIPLRRRLVLLQAVAVWTCVPFQHPAFVFGVALLVHSGASPAALGVVPLWSLNFGFFVWLYWEGLKINASSSAVGRRSWWEPFALILLLPLFSLWEAIGTTRGILKWLSRRDATFTVIAKPT